MIIGVGKSKWKQKRNLSETTFFWSIIDNTLHIDSQVISLGINRVPDDNKVHIFLRHIYLNGWGLKYSTKGRQRWRGVNIVYINT